MSILIICNNKDPLPWADAIKKKLPTTDIQVFPDVHSNDDINFAVCWKPDENVLSNFPGIRAIKSLGASLDVFDQEPLPNNHEFWDHPKIRITPHIASLTNVETAVIQIVENYKRLMRGEPLQNLVSHEKGY